MDNDIYYKNKAYEESGAFNINNQENKEGEFIIKNI